MIRAPQAGGIMQFGHHAGAVGTGVLSDYENRVGKLEVFEDTRTFTNSD